MHGRYTLTFNSKNPWEDTVSKAISASNGTGMGLSKKFFIELIKDKIPRDATVEEAQRIITNIAQWGINGVDNEPQVTKNKVQQKEIDTPKSKNNLCA